MSLSIHETFQVAAAPDRVFSFLTNPAEVVTCLPGAELTETIDERTYGGRVKVKVGPITSAYAGRATLVEVDAAEGRVKIVGEGKESGGPGSARMTLDGVVRALPGGGSEVHIDAVIDIVGRVMQFGRGLIESVSKQLFRQFVEAAQAKLAVESSEPDASSAHGAPETDGGAAEPDGADHDAVVSPSATAAATPPNESAGGAGAGSAPLPPVISDRRGAGDTRRPAVVTAERAAGGPAAIAAGRELHALPLLWKVFVSWLRERLGRSR